MIRAQIGSLIKVKVSECDSKYSESLKYKITKYIKIQFK